MVPGCKLQWNTSHLQSSWYPPPHKKHTDTIWSIKHTKLTPWQWNSVLWFKWSSHDVACYCLMSTVAIWLFFTVWLLYLSFGIRELKLYLRPFLSIPVLKFYNFKCCILLLWSWISHQNKTIMSSTFFNNNEVCNLLYISLSVCLALCFFYFLIFFVEFILLWYIILKTVALVDGTNNICCDWWHTFINF